jgi:hypothetical protein
MSACVLAHIRVSLDQSDRQKYAQAYEKNMISS